ncbi:MAG: hypothetical protein KBC15_03350 [Candidatus Levybacteria bacterium]|nr:hypothetical protein [Candidatus Levybacteria bacterium]
MNSLFQSKKTLFSALAVLLLAIGVPVGVYLTQQQQDVRQQAASKPDLEVRMFRLTDAAGNVRTTFYENEDIYVSVIIRNSGGAKGTSVDGITTSQIFSNRADTISFNKVSDVDIALKNSEFGSGSQLRYDSRLNGEGQARYTTTPYQDNATRKYSWRRTAAGEYTSRIILNFDKHVDESNFENNQQAIKYKVVPFTAADESGSFTTTQPADFTKWPCPVRTAINFPGVTGCVQQVRDASGTVRGKVTNNSGSPITIALASYKEYYPWKAITCSQLDCAEQYIQSWTQTFYKAKKAQVANGQTMFISTQVPPCAWQADLFINNLPFSFHPNRNTYRGIRYIDGWYHFYPTYNVANPELCKPDIPVLPSVTPTPKGPTPTPTKILTPTPTIPGVTITPTPTDTPTPTPTTTPGVTPTVTDTPTPTPTIPACVVPTKVANVKITCPNCSPNQ